MFTLVVTHEGRDYIEGQYIPVKDGREKIERITATGFLYNRSAAGASGVTVSDDEGKKTHFYKNWDYLDFVPASIKIAGA